MRLLLTAVAAVLVLAVAVPAFAGTSVLDRRGELLPVPVVIGTCSSSARFS